MNRSQKTEKLTNLFLNFYPFTLLLVFIRIFIVPVTFGPITKNVNLNLFALFFIVIFAVIVALLNTNFSAKKITKMFKSILPPLLLIGLANLISVFFSHYKIFSFLFFSQLAISYGLALASVLWYTLLKQQTAHIYTKLIYRFYKILLGINIYNFLLQIIQFITIAILKENYLNLPILIKRILFNGYFLAEVPPQRWDFSTYYIRPPGLLADTNVNAMFILISLLIFFTTYMFLNLFTTQKQQHYKLIKISKLGIFINSFAYLFSLSRSAMLGFAPLALIILITSWQINKNKTIKSLINLITPYVAIFIISLITFASISTTRHFMQNIGTKYIYNITHLSKDKSTYLHMLYSRVAIKLAEKNNYKPFGIGTFPRIYKEQVSRLLPNGASPHSLYATTLMEQGAIGLFLYTIAFIYIWIIYFKNLQTFKKYSKNSQKNIKLYHIFSLSLNNAIPFLTLSTIFYYGFWDISTWFYGLRNTFDIIQNNEKTKKEK